MCPECADLNFPPAFFAHLLDDERAGLTALPPAARSLSAADVAAVLSVYRTAPPARTE